MSRAEPGVRALCLGEHLGSWASLPVGLSSQGSFPGSLHQALQGLLSGPRQPALLGRGEHGGGRQCRAGAFCLAPGEAGLRLGLPAVCRCGTRPLPYPQPGSWNYFYSFPPPAPVLPWARDELLCLWRCQGSVPPECPQRQWAWGQRQMGALNLPSLPSASEVLTQPGPKRLLLRPPGTINVSVPFQHPGGPPPAPTGAPLAHHLGGNLYSSPSIAAQTQVETSDLIKAEPGTV